MLTMILWRKISVLPLFLTLVFVPVVSSYAMTEEDMVGKIESYLSAEKDGDYAVMAELLGMDEAELRRAVGSYMEGLKSYFAERLNLKLKEIRYGKYNIIFVRPGRNEAFVGQQIYVYFEDSGGLRRQHEYTLFRVTFDETAKMRWEPLVNSRGDFEEVGRES